MSIRLYIGNIVPRTFLVSLGQEHIVKNAHKSDSGGPDWTCLFVLRNERNRKTTVAKIFAKAVNCENPGPEWSLW